MNNISHIGGSARYLPSPRLRLLGLAAALWAATASASLAADAAQAGDGWTRLQYAALCVASIMVCGIARLVGGGDGESGSDDGGGDGGGD